MSSGEEDAVEAFGTRTPSPTPNAIAESLHTPPGQINDAFGLDDSEFHQLYYTPFVINETSRSESFLDPDSKARYLRLSKEAKRWLVGPMPAREFNEKFLPMATATSRSMPSSQGAFRKIPRGTSKEREIYTVLCEAVNDYMRCPGFYFADTSDLADSTGNGSMRPDLCLFSVKVPLKKIKNNNNKFIPNFGYLELFVEIKKTLTQDDPYQDQVGDIVMQLYELFKDDDSQETQSRNIGQTVAYASEQNARQHRTHCFSISVSKTKARLFRWDRAGVIMTESFDLHDNPEILCDFLWRYSHATDVQRGYDITVSKATRNEESKFEEVVKSHIRCQLSYEGYNLTEDELKELVKVHYEPDSVFKVPIHPQPPEYKKHGVVQEAVESVDVGDTQPWETIWRNEVEEALDDSPNANVFTSLCHRYTQVQHFLVSIPISAPLTIAGRGSRAYWAVKIPDTSLGETTHVIAFLKDTWRVAVEGFRKEGETMVELIEGGVRFVSDIICQGDVPLVSNVVGGSNPGSENNREYYTTVTNLFANKEWNRNRDEGGNPRLTTKYIHYRMASVEVGYSLDNFRGMKELIHGGRCAFLGAWSAHVLCGRHHRDISLKNIILVKKRGKFRVGYLTDWELSREDNNDEEARVYARSATWAFASIQALLSPSDFRYSIKDDIESFYYIILYASILWLPHKKVDDIEDRMQRFFGDYEEIEGQVIGAQAKVFNRDYTIFQNMWGFREGALTSWLKDVLDLQKFNQGINWTPRNLHNIWKNTDEKELPFNDKIDHLTLVRKKKGKQKAVPKQTIGSATRPSMRTSSSIHTQDRQTPQPRPPQIRSHGYQTRSSSKRQLADLDLEELESQIEKPQVSDESKRSRITQNSGSEWANT